MPLPPGVDPAHDALQVRELLDDVGDEVRLREKRRGPHLLHEIRAADLAGDRLGELLDPRSLLPVVAELLLERQARELGQPRLERLLRVLIEEEPGVSEPGVQHPFAALGDEALAVGVVVHDGDEVRQQAAGTAHRKELLVRAHDGHRDLFGEVEKLGRERAAHEPRPLDEVRERGGEIRVGLDLAAHLSGEGARPLEDRDPPCLGVRLDVGVAELREVVVRPGHREFAVGEHAVSHGAIARGDAVERERNDLPAVERHDAAHRAHEAARAFAPAHRLRKRQPCDDLRQDLREDLRGVAPGDRLAGGHGLAARRVDDDEVRDVDLLRLCESDGGLGGLAVLAEGAGLGRPEDLGRAVGLLLGKSAENEREAAERSVGLDLLRREALFLRAPRPSRGRAPAAPGAAPAPGSPPFGFPVRSLGLSSPPITAARAKPDVRSNAARLSAHLGPHVGRAERPQTAAGSGSEAGDRCPSFPET